MGSPNHSHIITRRTVTESELACVSQERTSRGPACFSAGPGGTQRKFPVDQSLRVVRPGRHEHRSRSGSDTGAGACEKCRRLQGYFERLRASSDSAFRVLTHQNILTALPRKR